LGCLQLALGERYRDVPDTKWLDALVSLVPVLDCQSAPGIRKRLGLFRQRWRELRSLKSAAASRPLPEIAAMVSECDYPHTREFYAMQKPLEMARFLDQATGLGPRGVLEIGTAAGGSLFLLCLIATRDARIVSVDLPGGEFGGGYEKSRRFFYRRFGRRGQRVNLLRGDSHDSSLVEQVRARLAERGGADLVFVDGDHSLAGVTLDYELYWPLVKPGGMMAFHDINPGTGPWGGGVPEFWARHRRNARSEEFVQEPSGGGYGIGVLWKENR